MQPPSLQPSSPQATARAAGTRAGEQSVSARVISVTSAAFNWGMHRWNAADHQDANDNHTSQERMPLLATKPSSPPCIAVFSGDTTGAATDSRSCKRTAYGSEKRNVHASNGDDEMRDLLSYSTASTANTMVRVGGWRLRMRDVVFGIAVAGGLTTLGLVYQSRHRHFIQDIDDTTTYNNVRSGFHVDESDESESMYVGGGGVPPGQEAAQLLRQAALQDLANELQLLRAHEVRRSVNGELNTTLRVGVKHFTDGPVSFWTRAYENSIPGPLWSVQPGDTINVQLVNELEPNVEGTWTPNTYHDPNSTNIHVHGMHVDPTGIADNILRTAHPGETLEYQYLVPTNHPRGLYHYHPHYHGSIYLQLAGGMSGPILVEDDEATLPDEYKHMKKHVLVLQEFRFDGGLGSDVRSANAAARSKLLHRPEYTSKTLLDAQLRALYPKVQLPSQRTDIPMSDTLKMHLNNGKRTKHKAKMQTPDISRFFTVNGQYLPKIEVQPNENVHLRFVNAGGSATVELSIPGCTIHHIASDGIYLAGPPRLRDVVVLSPGARFDVVINCQSTEPNGGPTREPLRPMQSTQDSKLDYFLGGSSDVYEGVLAFIHVSGASRQQPVVSTIPPVPELYGASADLVNLPQQELAALESFPFVFSMDNKRVMKDGFPYKNYFINHESFNMKSMREMPLNAVQEWVVVNERDEPKHDGTPGMLTAKNHPFHLHTNAFQIVSMTHGEGVDYKVGDWRDVIAVPTPGNVTVRFRPVNFRGAVLAHCHIAGHSDAGMVALVDIV